MSAPSWIWLLLGVLLALVILGLLGVRITVH